MFLVTALRRVLGTDVLTEMRFDMASAAEQLNALNDRLDDLVRDVRANTEILQTKAGQLDEEGQAALDRLSSNIASFDAEVGDADGSDKLETVEIPADDRNPDDAPPQ